MRSRNLIRAIREEWLSEDEIQMLQDGANAVLDWLSGQPAEPLKLLPSFSAIFLHAQSGFEAKTGVLALCHFLKRISDEDPTDANLILLMDALWADLQNKRVGLLLERLNGKNSLSHSENPEDYCSGLNDKRLEGLYENKMEGQNIDFFVQRLPFPLEVLDPRIVRIPPGKTNELHRHAHETVFIFFKGTGHVKVDEVRIPAKEGDFVFIPRWCRHQSVNEGPDEMVFLAVADFGLTGKSFFGNYLKTARLKPSTN